MVVNAFLMVGTGLRGVPTLFEILRRQRRALLGRRSYVSYRFRYCHCRYLPSSGLFAELIQLRPVTYRAICDLTLVSTKCCKQKPPVKSVGRFARGNRS